MEVGTKTTNGNFYSRQMPRKGGCGNKVGGLLVKNANMSI